tara:strand:- start:1170 stop:1673 length:504 start_codon:yes stop_codon:yes gene_type:complete
MEIETLGFGGGCHWCTEGVFQSLRGITSVEQGWISSSPPNNSFSEAVIVHFQPSVISLKDLIEIHLHTHSSTSNHAFRAKYRSAIYTNSTQQAEHSSEILRTLQPEFSESIITEVLPLKEFKMNTPEFLDYYYNNPNKPFCRSYIQPKLRLLMTKFATAVDTTKLTV